MIVCLFVSCVLKSIQVEEVLHCRPLLTQNKRNTLCFKSVRLMLVASQISEASLKIFSLAVILLPTYDHTETPSCCFLKLVKHTDLIQQSHSPEVAFHVCDLVFMINFSQCLPEFDWFLGHLWFSEVLGKMTPSFTVQLNLWLTHEHDPWESFVKHVA